MRIVSTATYAFVPFPSPMASCQLAARLAGTLPKIHASQQKNTYHFTAHIELFNWLHFLFEGRFARRLLKSMVTLANLFASRYALFDRRIDRIVPAWSRCPGLPPSKDQVRKTMRRFITTRSGHHRNSSPVWALNHITNRVRCLLATSVRSRVFSTLPTA